MIPLVGKATTNATNELPQRILIKVTEKSGTERAGILIGGDLGDPSILLKFSDSGANPEDPRTGRHIRLSDEVSHIDVGDIVAVERDSGRVRILFMARAEHHSFLVTEQCDNFCVMCSQPPRKINDAWLIGELHQVIPHLPKDTREIGFTGGEPTLQGQPFLDLLGQCRQLLPNTAVHVLSNGRRFADAVFAEAWRQVQHPDLMVGIPLYSDLSHVHDYVVQADGAYDETIRGILNLKRLNQRVELRIVLHKHTIERLEEFSHFVAGNLRFVDQVAIMGLELMGFAKANPHDLWIRLSEHKNTINRATSILRAAGITTFIFNIPLCVLHEEARQHAVKSISDWKREYAPECESCRLLDSCGGAFFSSRAMLAPEIRPVT